MAEASGFVLSVAGVLISLRGALDTALLIETFFDDAKQNSCRVGPAFCKSQVTPKAKFRWTIKGKDEFKERVSELEKLIDGLQKFTVDRLESHSLDRALPSIVLKHITNISMLRTLRDPEAMASSVLAMSAKAKLLQAGLGSPLEKSVTELHIDQLRLLRSSSSYTPAILPSPTAGPASVWVEWSIIGDGAEAPEYIRRVKTLGYLLQEAGGPALRLPVCYGIFDDLTHEVESRARRIGYVFGAPRTSRSSPFSFGPSDSSPS
ncbi:hypothetical protein F4859DRAFT_518508 [Xylaria cf. heliscus]|nr:hypothetical protein F4859DRAFT_518508 [Xylaria cf. heliscus]